MSIEKDIAGNSQARRQSSATRRKATDQKDGDRPGKEIKRRARTERAKIKIREKIVAAAMKVMAEKGIDQTKIVDVTEEADIGFGSFYNYFESKDQLILFIINRQNESLNSIVSEIGDKEDDIGVAVAYNIKVFFEKSLENPIWGRFIVYAADGLPEFMKIFSSNARTHIQKGVDSGRFSVKNISVSVRIIFSSILTTMRGILEGEILHGEAEDTVECLLRMLGLNETEARFLSHCTLPDYISELIEQHKRTVTASALA